MVHSATTTARETTTVIPEAPFGIGPRLAKSSEQTSELLSSAGGGCVPTATAGEQREHKCAHTSSLNGLSRVPELASEAPTLQPPVPAYIHHFPLPNPQLLPPKPQPPIPKLQPQTPTQRSPHTNHQVPTPTPQPPSPTGHRSHRVTVLTSNNFRASAAFFSPRMR